MKSTAKYLFDDDFSASEKQTITLMEAERRRADAESAAHRKGFAAGLEQAQGEALAVIADGLERLTRALAGIEARLESEAVEVAVAVAAKLAPALIAHARGFEGRLVVLSDPAMAPGDCRIEWADGGVARDRAATLATIDDAVARYVAARTSANT